MLLAQLVVAYLQLPVAYHGMGSGKAESFGDGRTPPDKQIKQMNVLLLTVTQHRWFDGAVRPTLHPHTYSTA